MRNFVQYCLNNKGSIHPLLLDPSLTNGTGLMNPSIFIDGGKILTSVRHVNYTLFHSEEKKFLHYYGPLQYIHPENDCTLKTVNYLCELNENLEIIRTDQIDTSKLDVTPIWEFVGLEDIRIFRWNDKLYGCGVRRDTTTNGQGRMELSELEITNNQVHEISRFRIPAPGDDSTYCEKNWMPILDKPFCFIKWSNPTEVVKVDINTKTCKTIHLEESNIIPGLCDFRGGSQVIKWNDYYLAIIHEVRLFNSELGRKDGKYYHRFVLWDHNFNIVKFSDLFDFMEGDIEFSCGLALQDNNFLVSFGFQDNCAFILKFPESIMFDMLDLPNSIKDTDVLKLDCPNLFAKPIPVIGAAIVNGVHWIKRLINSVDYPVENFIIFNNNGRGQLTKELDHICQNNTNDYINKVSVCHLPANIGCGGAWNMIIKSYINASYWIIANHDVAFTPGFLERMLELANDPEVGIVHGTEGGWKIGGWELFLIKDFVISKFGLFDENLYPAYEEDMDYFMRILADGNTLKRITSVDIPFLHGYETCIDYDNSGSQTSREDPNIKELIDIGQTLNQIKYMDQKWSPTWRMCQPSAYPFDNNNLPLSYTSYDLNFIRSKYLGF